MLCEKCKKRAAAVAIHERVNGRDEELYVCKACAQEPADKQLAQFAAMMLDVTMEVVGSHFRGTAEDHGQSEPRCGTCGMSRTELRKNERLGCDCCYETFADDVNALIADMHLHSQHKGKVPSLAQVGVKRQELTQRLEMAITAQNFEEAARLRDQLAMLERRSPECGAGGDDGHAR